MAPSLQTEVIPRKSHNQETITGQYMIIEHARGETWDLLHEEHVFLYVQTPNNGQLYRGYPKKISRNFHLRGPAITIHQWSWKQ